MTSCQNRVTISLPPPFKIHMIAIILMATQDQRPHYN